MSEIGKALYWGLVSCVGLGDTGDRAAIAAAKDRSMGLWVGIAFAGGARDENHLRDGERSVVKERGPVVKGKAMSMCWYGQMAITTCAIKTCDEKIWTGKIAQ